MMLMGERADRPGDAGRRSERHRCLPTSPTRGDEDYVGAREGLFDLLGVVLGGAAAHLGVGTGTQSSGDLAADVGDGCWRR